MDEALGTGEAAAKAGTPAGRVSVAEAGELDATTTDPDPEFSLVTASGASAVGSTFLDREPDPPAWTERLLQRAISFVPGVLDAPIREVRACARPASIDGHPLAGAAPGIRDLFVAAGHGPWGISTGPATARHVADLVLGRDAAIDAAFDPARFGIIPA